MTTERRAQMWAGRASCHGLRRGWHPCRAAGAARGSSLAQLACTGAVPGQPHRTCPLRPAGRPRYTGDVQPNISTMATFRLRNSAQIRRSWRRAALRYAAKTLLVWNERSAAELLLQLCEQVLYDVPPSRTPSEEWG